ncbi:MAG: hypothetical protein ACO1SV_21965 [Fimbriimonas sp.]
MDPSTPTPRGRIEDVGMLNLLSARTPEDFDGITGIEDVGCILVPEHLATAFVARVPMEDVGTIAAIPQDGKVVLVTGQATYTGEALENGDPEALLVVAGQLRITTPVTRVGFRGLHIIGQAIAPRGSESALASAISHVSGQISFYPEGARMFTGHESVGREFLEYLPKPTPFLISGHFTFEDDVTAELLREKVSEISLSGHLEAPRRLVPLIQFLTTDKSGNITARD